MSHEYAANQKGCDCERLVLRLSNRQNLVSLPFSGCTKVFLCAGLKLHLGPGMLCALDMFDIS